MSGKTQGQASRFSDASDACCRCSAAVAEGGLRHGLNSSTDATVNGINYTRMTNFLAYSLASKLGDDALDEIAAAYLEHFVAGSPGLRPL